jgi:hypothetical protein
VDDLENVLLCDVEITSDLGHFQQLVPLSGAMDEDPDGVVRLFRQSHG